MEPSPQRIASRYRQARTVTLGYASRSSGNYGSEISLKLDLAGSQVFFELSKWSQIGGMDSLHGAGKPDVTPKGSVAANGRDVVSKLRSLMKEDIWLAGYKISEFQWKTGFSKKIQGLTLTKAQAAIDSWSMDRAEWEAKWEKPVVRPSGGPFSFDRSTTMQDMAAQLAAQGFATKPARLLSMKGGTKLVLQNGRQMKQLYKMLEASADSVQKTATRDGWDLFKFNFGGQEIHLAKENYGYPIKGNAWGIGLG